MSSHYGMPSAKRIPDKKTDWGDFQIANALDMEVTGNAYIDCFLTAGLGTHRVHHVLPY